MFIDASRARHRLSLVGALAATLLLAGCASGDPGTPAPSAEAPVDGGTLRFGMLQDTQGFDPALTTDAGALTMDGWVFDRLVAMSPEKEIEPMLASSWKISDDGLTYTFTLREGVLFHDGTPMTAKDAAFSIERLRTNEKSPRRTLMAPIESVTAPDDSTLKITLAEPYGPLLSYLSLSWASVVSQAVVEANGDLNDMPIGTGPFKLKEWKKDELVSFVKNPDYWVKGKPHLDGIDVSFNTESNARQAALASGQLDYIYRMPPELATPMGGDPAVQLFGQGEGENWLYMLLNLQQEPFNSVEARQAVFHGLDRAAIAAVCYPDASSPLNAGFLRADGPYGVTDPFPQDLKAAKKKLADAGMADGFSFEVMALSGWDFQICAAEMAQQQLKPLGIDVQIKVTDLGQINAARSEGNFQSMVLAWSGTVDPDQRFSEVFLSSGGSNNVKYTNPEVDKMITAARESIDQTERAELYRKIQKQITKDSGHAFLYNYDTLDVASSKVKGYKWMAESYGGVVNAWLAD